MIAAGQSAVQVSYRRSLNATDSQADSIASYCLRRGLRLKDGPGSARASAVGAGLRWGFILSPSARTGLADLAPWAKVVQTVVCSTFTHGDTRYPEGGRRREDESLGEGWCVRANAGDDEHQGDEHLKSVRAGALPCARAYGLVVPAVSPPDVLRGRGRIFPAPARGNPAPRAIRPGTQRSITAIAEQQTTQLSRPSG
jgi:hypothetical protein